MTAMRTSRALVLALGLCLIATSAAVAQQQIALVDIGDNGVIWSPLTADKAVLTISGPSGDFRYELEVGEKAAFEIFDKAGALIQDGTYSWQMTTLPTVSAETRDAMQKARAEGTRFTGTLPQSFTQSGALMVKSGYFVLPAQEAANKPAEVVTPNKDQIIADDLIVQQSACVGQDCVNGESFGFDTLRLKENNLRIKFQDTSNSASFPSNDWQITANDSTNGGSNKFSIDDIDGGRTPFTLTAGAPSHSIFVDSGGRIGVGTSTPVVEMHVVNGDSPTVRLEQDGSSGFTPQTWDMAGNETNWFVRDATNGSRLPLKIRPSAPTNSIFVDTDGDIGLQTSSPDAALHVRGTDGDTSVHIQELNGTQSGVLLNVDSDSVTSTSPLVHIDTATTGGTVTTMLNMVTAGARPRMTMTHGGTGTSWNFDILNTTGNFALIRGGAAGPQMTFESTTGDVRFTNGTTGNMYIEGDYFRSGVAIPDWVFAEDYDLMPLDDVKAFIDENSHLPEVPSTAEVEANGLNMTDMQLKLLQKVEELTLYTIEQHETIRKLQERLDAVESVQQ